MTFTGGGHDRTLVVGPSNVNKCGGELYPWRLRVDSGQRVNVTLVQFIEHHADHREEADDAALTPVRYNITQSQHVIS